LCSDDPPSIETTTSSLRLQNNVLLATLPAFEAEAAKLDRILTPPDEDDKGITIVTHSNGGLVAMRTLLNRAKDFPSKTTS